MPPFTSPAELGTCSGSSARETTRDGARWGAFEARDATDVRLSPVGTGYGERSIMRLDDTRGPSSAADACDATLNRRTCGARLVEASGCDPTHAPPVSGEHLVAPDERPDVLNWRRVDRREDIARIQ